MSAAKPLPPNGRSLDPPKWLTPFEAATYIRFSASTLAKLRVYGDGPAYVKHGSRVLYERAVLDQWMADRVRHSTSERGA